MKRSFWVFILLFVIISFSLNAAAAELQFWSEGSNKQAIISFVKEVTNKDSVKYVPPSQRIAVFDNDGTIQLERPLFFCGVYTCQRIKTLEPKHPEWNKYPFTKEIVNLKP